MLTKAVRIVGTSGQVFIQSDGRECLSVRASGVAVQNVQFICNGIGELPAISVAENAELELEGCKVQSSTAVAVAVTGNAAIKSLGTGFSAPNGIAMRLNQQARGTFRQSSFSDNKIALTIYHASAAELQSCAFERNGGAEAKGGTIALSGSKSTLTANDCHFTNNSAGLSAVEGATLTINNSTFNDNGVTPRTTGVLGLIALYRGSHGALTSNTFEANQQGVTITEGSVMEITKCLFAGNGTRQTREVIPSCQPIAASGKARS